MSEFRRRVEHSFDKLGDLRERWDELAARFGSCIYSSYDWCHTWWDFFGGSKRLCVLVLLRNDVVVSILPTYVDTVGFGPVSLRIARLVGSAAPPKAYHPPVDPGVAKELLSLAVEWLFKNERCDVISYGSIPEGGGIDNLVEVCEKVVGCSVQKYVDGLHSVFDLPATMDEYLASLGKDERKKRTYELRLLRKLPELKEEVVGDPGRIESEFDVFAELHASQWQTKGKGGHFLSWPKAMEFNRELVKRQALRGRARFVCIRQGDLLISSQYVFAFGDTLFWELPARVMGKDWNRYSLGVVGFLSVVEESIRLGLRRIEGGVARYEYKQKLGAKEIPLLRVRLVRGGWSSAVRNYLFRGFRAVMEICYHKIWYKRLLPRMPSMFNRTQWPIWLRLDY